MHDGTREPLVPPELLLFHVAGEQTFESGVLPLSQACVIAYPTASDYSDNTMLWMVP
jgi:hypothetical protein